MLLPPPAGVVDLLLGAAWVCRRTATDVVVRMGELAASASAGDVLVCSAWARASAWRWLTARPASPGWPTSCCPTRAAAPAGAGPASSPTSAVPALSIARSPHGARPPRPGRRARRRRADVQRQHPRPGGRRPQRGRRARRSAARPASRRADRDRRRAWAARSASTSAPAGDRARGRRAEGCGAGDERLPVLQPDDRRPVRCGPRAAGPPEEKRSAQRPPRAAHGRLQPPDQVRHRSAAPPAPHHRGLLPLGRHAADAPSTASTWSSRSSTPASSPGPTRRRAVPATRRPRRDVEPIGTRKMIMTASYPVLGSSSACSAASGDSVVSERR